MHYSCKCLWLTVVEVRLSSMTAVVLRLTLEMLFIWERQRMSDNACIHSKLRQRHVYTCVFNLHLLCYRTGVETLSLSAKVAELGYDIRIQKDDGWETDVRLLKLLLDLPRVLRGNEGEQINNHIGLIHIQFLSVGFLGPVGKLTLDTLSRSSRFMSSYRCKAFHTGWLLSQFL